MEDNFKLEKELIKFIKDNGLEFTVGRRNHDCTIISGFGIYKGLNIYEEDILLFAVKKAIPNKLYTDELISELKRVFTYAYENSYGYWWETPDAEKQYKFTKE